MKTIHLTNDQHEVIIAILTAVQLGEDARAAAQRAQEINDDVEPVGEGSEEEAAIWEHLEGVFDTIRAAPDMVISRDQMSRLWDRYYAIVDVNNDGPITDSQKDRLRALIKEAPKKRKRDGSGMTSGYWIYEDSRGRHLAVGIHLAHNGEPCMCDEEVSDVNSRT